MACDLCVRASAWSVAARVDEADLARYAVVGQKGGRIELEHAGRGLLDGEAVAEGGGGEQRGQRRGGEDVERRAAAWGQAQQLEPRSDYRAVVFPDDPGAWLFDSPRITSVPIPASGRFSVSGLLPGRYRVAIVEHLRPLLDEWFDVEWLERLQRLATMVEVEAGGAATVEVRPVEVPEG